MNFQDNLSAMPDISHLSGLDILDAQGKLGSLKLYNALAQEFDNRLDSAAAERGLSLFAEHTADARANPGKHPNIDLLFKVKTENLVLQLRPVEARS